MSAHAEVQRLFQADSDRHSAAQCDLDLWWQQIVTNQPNVVMAHLARSFEDNEASAAAIGIDEDAVSLVVLLPPEDAMPTHMPGTTAAGNPSLRKMTNAQSAMWCNTVCCGFAVVTVKEAFAAAPGLRSATIVAVRPSAPDAYGLIQSECLLAATFSRDRLRGVQWVDATASAVVSDAADRFLINPRGSTWRPLDLSKEPEIRAVLDAMDLRELMD